MVTSSPLTDRYPEPAPVQSLKQFFSDLDSEDEREIERANNSKNDGDKRAELQPRKSVKDLVKKFSKNNSENNSLSSKELRNRNNVNYINIDALNKSMNSELLRSGSNDNNHTNGNGITRSGSLGSNSMDRADSKQLPRSVSSIGTSTIAEAGTNTSPINTTGIPRFFDNDMKHSQDQGTISYTMNNSNMNSTSRGVGGEYGGNGHIIIANSRDGDISPTSLHSDHSQLRDQGLMTDPRVSRYRGMDSRPTQAMNHVDAGPYPNYNSPYAQNGHMTDNSISSNSYNGPYSNGAYPPSKYINNGNYANSAGPQDINFRSDNYYNGNIGAHVAYNNGEDMNSRYAQYDGPARSKYSSQDAPYPFREGSNSGAHMQKSANSAQVNYYQDKFEVFSPPAQQMLRSQSVSRGPNFEASSSPYDSYSNSSNVNTTPNFVFPRPDLPSGEKKPSKYAKADYGVFSGAVSPHVETVMPEMRDDARFNSRYITEDNDMTNFNTAVNASMMGLQTMSMDSVGIRSGSMDNNVSRTPRADTSYDDYGRDYAALSRSKSTSVAPDYDGMYGNPSKYPNNYNSPPENHPPTRGILKSNSVDYISIQKELEPHIPPSQYRQNGINSQANSRANSRYASPMMLERSASYRPSSNDSYIGGLERGRSSSNQDLQELYGSAAPPNTHNSRFMSPMIPKSFGANDRFYDKLPMGGSSSVKSGSRYASPVSLRVEAEPMGTLSRSGSQTRSGSRISMSGYMQSPSETLSRSDSRSTSRLISPATSRDNAPGSSQLARRRSTDMSMSVHSSMHQSPPGVLLSSGMKLPRGDYDPDQEALDIAIQLSKEVVPPPRSADDAALEMAIKLSEAEAKAQALADEEALRQAVIASQRETRREGPSETDKEALEIGILLSEQEAKFGTNMYESLSAEDDPAIERMIKKLGYSEKDAIETVFMRKFNKVSMVGTKSTDEVERPGVFFVPGANSNDYEDRSPTPGMIASKSFSPRNSSSIDYRERPLPGVNNNEERNGRRRSFRGGKGDVSRQASQQSIDISLSRSSSTNESSSATSPLNYFHRGFNASLSPSGKQSIYAQRTSSFNDSRGTPAPTNQRLPPTPTTRQSSSSPDDSQPRKKTVRMGHVNFVEPEEREGGRVSQQTGRVKYTEDNIKFLQGLGASRNDAIHSLVENNGDVNKSADMFLSSYR